MRQIVILFLLHVVSAGNVWAQGVSVDDLIAQLRETDAKKRATACVQLSLQGAAAKTAIPSLIGAAIDDDSTVRESASRALMQIRIAAIEDDLRTKAANTSQPEKQSPALLNSVAHLLQSVAWPGIILLLTWLLRDDIRGALTRAQKLKFPGGAEFAFGTSPTDLLAAGRVTKEKVFKEENVSNARWDRIGSLYWLGHDIMWTVDAILRDASVVYIRHGMKQVTHHIEQVGLASTTSGGLLRALYDSTARSSTLNSAQRLNLASQLQTIANQIGAVIESHQKDFDSGIDVNTHLAVS